MTSPVTPRTSHSRRPSVLRASAVALTGSALAIGGSLALLGPSVSLASSHREAPLIAGDPQVDNTDLYAFVSPDKSDSVTLIANFYPDQRPTGGPNFFPFSPDARYNIKLDTNGDAKPDIIYQWKFKTQDLRGTKTFLYNNGVVTSLTDPNLLFRQTYTLTKFARGHSKVLVRNGKVAPSHVGKASMPDYAGLRQESITRVRGGGQTFAGQADDPFFLDLRVMDLLYGGNLSEVGDNTLKGFNVNSLALQVPKSELRLRKDGIVGVWSTTDRPSMKVAKADGTQKYAGHYVQVSRLGMPLVNELVVPAGLKDAFNALSPEKDRTIKPVVDRVLKPELAMLIEKIYGIPAPATPRKDLVAIFLTGLKGLNQPAGVTPAEMLRLNTKIPPSAAPDRLGVLAGDNAGFPNGRRLTDDVVDIEIQAVEGAVSVDKNGAPTGVKIVEALKAGDAVDANDYAFGSSFPYLALPTSGSTVLGAPVTGSTSSSAILTGAASSGSGISGTPLVSGAAGGLGLLLAGLGLLLFRRERRQAVMAP